MTPVNHSKTAKAPYTSVVDTGEKFTGVNDAGSACFAGVVDSGKSPKLMNISANIRKNWNSF
jgi:hypothetical protein